MVQLHQSSGVWEALSVPGQSPDRKRIFFAFQANVSSGDDIFGYVYAAFLLSWFRLMGGGDGG